MSVCVYAVFVCMCVCVCVYGEHAHVHTCIFQNDIADTSLTILYKVAQDCYTDFSCIQRHVFLVPDVSPSKI